MELFCYAIFSQHFLLFFFFAKIVCNKNIITFVFCSFAVSMETTTFFGAGLGFMVIVVVFFLYMNRKWCFSNSTGNFPCCDDEKFLSTKTIHSFSKYLRMLEYIFIEEFCVPHLRFFFAFYIILTRALKSCTLFFLYSLLIMVK